MKRTNSLISCTCDLICKELEKYIAKANNDLIKTLKKAGYVDSSYTVKQAEKLEDELSDILQGKTDEFIKLLQDNPNASISDIIDKMPDFNKSTNIATQLQTVFNQQFKSSVTHIANSYIKSIDKELTVEKITIRTSNWINTWSEQLADIMNVNTEDKLRNILSRAMEKGKGVEKVAQELVENGAIDNITRARTTALTEMLRANSVSAQEAYIQSPAVSDKKWRHTGARKSNPRENHIDMDGQIVAVNEPFELIGADGKIYYPMYPRDSCLPPGESINCHCIHQPIVSKDVLGMSLKEREKLQDRSINTDNENWKKEQKEQKKKAKTLDNKNSSVIMNVKASNGVKVKSLSKHTLERCEERGVTKNYIKEALKNPLHISDVKTDSQGRKSQRFIGENATVNINPDTGKVSTVWKTGARTIKKYQKE